MQIITIDDLDFPAVLEALNAGTAVGQYWRDGTVQIVYVTRQFVLVSQGDDPKKIAIRPARGISEAETIAMRLLDKEKSRGNRVELRERA